MASPWVASGWRTSIKVLSGVAVWPHYTPGAGSAGEPICQKEVGLKCFSRRGGQLHFRAPERGGNPKLRRQYGASPPYRPCINICRTTSMAISKECGCIRYLAIAPVPNMLRNRRSSAWDASGLNTSKRRSGVPPALPRA